MSGIAMPMAYNVELTAPLVTQMPVTLLGEDDQKANELVLTFKSGGAAASLTGLTVTGYFLRPVDGVTVRCPGTISGNVATNPLPANCYSYPGAYVMVVKLSSATVTRTVLRLAGTVVGNGSGTVIDPSGTIPTTEQIATAFAKLEEGIAAIEAATAAANTAAGNANEKAAAANAAAANANEKAALADAKAALADTAATAASEAAASIDGMTVSASGLASGASPTVAVSDVSGHKAIAFGIPKGDTGNRGAPGAPGARGSVAYSGTAITGSSTTPTAYPTGILAALPGDRYYYNGTSAANVGNVYICTAGGDAAAALWVFDGNIRGEAGSGNVSFVNGVPPDIDGDVLLSGGEIPVSGTDATPIKAALDGKQALLDASNPLPIEGGGTGGTTGPEALENLGYVDKAVWTELWTGTLSPGGSITIPNLSSNWMQICVRAGAPLANIPLVVFGTPLRGSAAYSGTNSQIVISVDLGISGNNVTLNSCMAATHSSSGHTIADNTVVGIYGMIKR